MCSVCKTFGDDMHCDTCLKRLTFDTRIVVATVYGRGNRCEDCCKKIKGKGGPARTRPEPRP